MSKNTHDGGFTASTNFILLFESSNDEGLEMEYLTIGISVLALIVSGATLWLTHLRQGALKMTRPTVVFFGPDSSEGGISKVFLRTLLYTTGKRGIVLENLFIRLRRGETQQNFNVWVYGEKDLARGSGLFVGQQGIATNHHFLTPTDIRGFHFAAGDYELDVFGKLVGKDSTLLLSTIRLSIDAHEAEQLRKDNHGIYFDWGPDAGRYQKKIEGRRSKEIDPLKFLEALQDGEALSLKKPHENATTKPS
ncbi:hypothetical protein [Fulvimarina sp. MAC8]|uniref:hypothetical protein n=1 Tax=Fulvimarina sp. MAC8 TaxID=3162874 RepID=UPI0032ECC2FF